MSVGTQVFRLEELLPKVPEKSREFARSLVGQWRQKRRLSQSQQLWVDKLIVMATEEPKAPEPKPVAESLNVGLEKLHALFDKARSHVRSNESYRPKLHLVLDDGRPVEVYAAKDSSKNPGSIYVTVSGHYYGKIDRNGGLTLGPRGERVNEIHDRIRAVCENPTAAGRLHGHKHVWCMFCGIKLESPESKYYGYGPICADKWGLEWGSSKERKQEELESEIESKGKDLFSMAAAKYFGGLKSG